jgi:hypothetical protein
MIQYGATVTSAPGSAYVEIRVNRSGSVALSAEEGCEGRRSASH